MIEIPEKDGKIDLGGKFSGWLWKKGDFVYISFIQSLDEGKGNLSRLFNSILKQGYGIKVPTPFPRMEMICRKKGFVQTWENDDVFNEACEVWTKVNDTNERI